MSDYRQLKMGEIVHPFDEIYDDAKRSWVQPVHSVGKPAPDPRYTAHRQFRRHLNPDGSDAYESLREAAS